MKIIKSVITVAAVLFFGGCTQENGPTIDYLLHGTMSRAHLTKNLMKIPKNKTIYIDDITKIIDLDTSADDAYSSYIGSTKICAPGVETISFLREKGYKIVTDKKKADYIIKMQNLGCGLYGDIKNHIHAPQKVGKDIDGDMKSIDAQNAQSFTGLSSSLSHTGHSTAAGVSAALGVLSLFNNPNSDYMTFDAVTIYDKKSKEIKQSVIYSKCYGSGIRDIMNYGSKEVAKKLYTEISSISLFGM